MDSIKDKINKLLAMATHQNSNEQESETAMRMAEAMMKKHCIELSELEAATGKCSVYDWRDVNCGAGPIEGKAASWRPMWIGFLGVAVAKFCDVKMTWWQTKELGHCVKFQGDVIDLEYAEWLFEKLRDFGYIESNAVAGIHRETFRKAYAIRLSGRMRELRAARDVDLAQAKTKTGTALMVVENKLSLRDAEFGRMKTKSVNPKLGSDGFNQGRAAADRANFNRPIGSSGGTARLQ